MLVNVSTTQTPVYRWLVLAPHNRNLANLDQLSDESDVAALVKAGSMHVDALIGDVTEDEIAQTLLSGNYNGFHGALHGDPDGLALTKEFLERDQLGELLYVHGVKLAVLLSCQSSDVAKRVAEAGVCCVVGTTVEITNGAAYAFCLKFYRHLVKERDAGKAFEYARRLLQTEWRTWFTLIRAEDCSNPGMHTSSDYRRLSERIKALEDKIDRLLTICQATQQSSRDGHEQITEATLKLVNLFSGLMGGKR